jgi:hypothetical protein
MINYCTQKRVGINFLKFAKQPKFCNSPVVETQNLASDANAGLGDVCVIKIAKT